MNSNNAIEIPRHERMPIAILLAMAGGYMDVYTYVTRAGVFANAQTGNIVLLGMEIAQGNWNRLLKYVLPILAFFFGVLLTDWIKYKCNRRQMLTWEYVSLILEIILLFLVGLAGSSVPDELITVIISFVCSVQVHSFRRVNQMPYASTMCTGNLRSAAENLFSWMVGKNPQGAANCANYLKVIGAFILGAMLAVPIIDIAGQYAIWACCLFLIVTLVIFIKFFPKNNNKVDKSASTS